MESKIIYGIVINNKFYSNNMEVKIKAENGIYSIDVASDEYLNTLQYADIIDFEKFIKNSKKLFFINGYSFRDKFIPSNMMKYKSETIPIKLIDSVANDWEYIKVLYIPHKNIFYYINTVYNDLQLKLSEIEDLFEHNLSLTNIKDVTPEMRILFSFHSLEKIQKDQERIKLENEKNEKTIESRLKNAIENSGGIFYNYKKINGVGYEVKWSTGGELISSVINENFSILEAGYCIGGHDRSQSLRSIVKLLQTHIEEGEYIHKTRNTN